MAKPTLLLLLSALIFGLSPGRVVAQVVKNSTAADKRKAEIAAIKSYEHEVIFEMLSHQATLRQFVKVSPTASWQEVKPESGRLSRHFLVASVGFHQGKPVRVSMSHWRKNQETSDDSTLLFHPDGTLAKYILVVEVGSKDTLRASKIKVQYFDAKGKPLLTLIARKDVKSREFTRLKTLSVPELPLHLKVEQLPFYPLLKDKAAAIRPTPTPSTGLVKPGPETPSK